MNRVSNKRQHSPSIITFYHDTEQNYDSNANPLECRKMVDEFLKLEKKYSIPVTYNVVGKLFDEQPDLIKRILVEGQEVAFHSFNHQTDWNEKYFSNEIDLCRKTSQIPTGYRSPRSQINRNAVKTIWEKGFLWNAEGDFHKEPYFIYKGLVRLPIIGDDWPLYLGEVTTERWVQNFSSLLQTRTYIAFGLHDYIASFDPENILRAWEKILQLGIESGALLLNFSEAAELFRRTAYSRYSKLNNRKDSNEYWDRSFDVVVRNELEKLPNSIVANIYFINQNLPMSINALAKEIINVPIDSEILTDIESKNINAQMNYADLILCTNCIEYQFYPGRLADLIKKIGKIGATYIITFPNYDGEYSSLTSFPECTAHLFTQEEIKEWSDQIGPGNILYMDEATSNVSKFPYHRNFKNGKYWIYIGIVQKLITNNFKKRNISINEDTLQFPNPLLENLRINWKLKKGKLLNVLRRFGKKVLKLFLVL